MVTILHCLQTLGLSQSKPVNYYSMPPQQAVMMTQCSRLFDICPNELPCGNVKENQNSEKMYCVKQVSFLNTTFSVVKRIVCRKCA